MKIGSQFKQKHDIPDKAALNIVCWGKLLYVLVTLLNLLPIWLLSRLPTIDGPLHFYNANLISKLTNGQWPLHEIFLELNERFDPNWFLHIIIIGFTSITSFEVAEKILQSLYMLAFSAGLYYAIIGINKQAWYIAFAGLPLISNVMFHGGFYSFVLSLPVALVVFGYWFRYGDKLTVFKASVLALLLAVLYATHVVSYVVTVFSVGILLVSQLFVFYLRSRGLAGFVLFLKEKEIFLAVAALLPSFLLFIYFLSSREVIVVDSNGPLLRLAHLIGSTLLASFDYVELIFSVLFSLMLYGAATFYLWRFRKNPVFLHQDILLVVFIAVCLLYLFLPETQVVTPGGLGGGGFIQSRLSFYPIFVLIFWLASKPVNRIVRKSFIVIGSLITLCLLVVHVDKYQRINTYIDHYVTASEQIENGSVVLPIRLSEMNVDTQNKLLSFRFDPFMREFSRIALKKDLITLDNIQAQYGYFPVRFKQSMDPYKTQGKLSLIKPSINIELYEESTGQKIDYVALWGVGRVKEDSATQHIYRELQRSFDKVFTSKYGLMELYKRKNDS